MGSSREEDFRTGSVQKIGSAASDWKQIRASRRQRVNERERDRESSSESKRAELKG